MAGRINEISGQWPDEPSPGRPARTRLHWQPEQGFSVPIRKKTRFDLESPGTPQMNYLSQSDLDALLARIKGEEALPPHKKNTARISALKRQALEMMKRLESRWVEWKADLLLPRIDESQAG